MRQDPIALITSYFEWEAVSKTVIYEADIIDGLSVAGARVIYMWCLLRQKSIQGSCGIST